MYHGCETDPSFMTQKFHKIPIKFRFISSTAKNIKRNINIAL